MTRVRITRPKQSINSAQHNKKGCGARDTTKRLTNTATKDTKSKTVCATNFSVGQKGFVTVYR